MPPLAPPSCRIRLKIANGTIRKDSFKINLPLLVMVLVKLVQQPVCLIENGRQLLMRKQNLQKVLFFSNYARFNVVMKREYTHKGTYCGIPCYYNSDTHCLIGKNRFYTIIIDFVIMSTYYFRPLVPSREVVLIEELHPENRFH